MDTRTFKERYGDSSNVRKAWVRKMLCIELGIDERQALRYIYGVTGSNKLIDALLERVFMVSERTRDYKELVAMERLPDETPIVKDL